MPLRVYHQKKRYRTQFRRLPIGQAFWLASNVATTPFVKRNSAGYIGGWAADGSPTLTTVSDTSVAVVKVPGVFMGQNRTLN